MSPVCRGKKAEVGQGALHLFDWTTKENLNGIESA